MPSTNIRNSSVSWYSGMSCYYPFGMQMQGREFAGGMGYRWMFNGFEVDPNIKGNGNSYTTEFRQYDARLGRWLTIDPLSLEFASWSPYNSMVCRPISVIDPNGKAPQDWIKRAGSNTWEYDSDVQTEAGARAKYGESTHYKDDGDTYEGSYAGKNIGTVTLNTGGEQTWKGGSYQNSDLNPAPSSSLSTASNWYTPLTNTNFLYGTSTTILGLSLATYRLTDGLSKGANFSPKLYNSGWTGGSRARISTYSVSKTAGMLGKVSFFGGLSFDMIGVYNYYTLGEKSSNAVHPAKAAVNTGIGVVGLKWNPAIAIFYSGVDAFFPGGWLGDDEHEGAIRYTSGLTDRNRRIVPNFNLYRDVPGGF